MVKTTVYLSESQAAALRRLADLTGCSQAEIIREAVDRATQEQLPPRRLRSIGAGASTGEPIEDWDAEFGRILEERFRKYNG